jgi:diadenosine tetraphosphate (Ap4A) HIT family hydrolase
LYLAIPAYGRITEGHCIIVPMDHVTAVTAFDENVYEEYMVRLCALFFSFVGFRF